MRQRNSNSIQSNVPGLTTSGHPIANCTVSTVFESPWLILYAPPLNVPTSSLVGPMPSKCAAGGAPPGDFNGEASGEVNAELVMAPGVPGG